MVRRPIFSKIFSETAWPIKAKFCVEPPWVWGTKFYPRHLCHMTRTAATPKYGKHPSKSSSNEYFFGSNGLPAGRFFSRDGIHLSNSGTKRLVDAISSKVDIVHDFQLCIFQNRRYQQKRNYDQEQFVHNARSYHPGGNNRRPQFNGRWNNQKLCYACSMPGHVIADCWFAQ